MENLQITVTLDYTANLWQNLIHVKYWLIHERYDKQTDYFVISLLYFMKNNTPMHIL